jgi:hypothetical protein
LQCTQAILPEHWDFSRTENVEVCNANVDDFFALPSQQLRKHKIDNICAAIEAFVYGAKMVPTTKHRQFQVLLTSTW